MTARQQALIAVALVALAGAPLSALAATLLDGSSPGLDGASVAFQLDGDSRDDPVGGEIRLGAERFTIERVSRLGVIGGRGVEASEGAFAIFSSSFSDQTAVGNPYPAAQRYLGCDADYNSFLAVYEITDSNKLIALGDVPYAVLTESVESSDASTVFCFMSRPPA